jgi:hypothetical protein
MDLHMHGENGRKAGWKQGVREPTREKNANVKLASIFKLGAKVSGVR